MTDAAADPPPRHAQVDEVGTARWIHLTRPGERNDAGVPARDLPLTDDDA